MCLKVNTTLSAYSSEQCLHLTTNSMLLNSTAETFTLFFTLVSRLVGLLQVHLGHDHDPDLINRSHSTLPGIHGQSAGESMLLHVHIYV